MEDQFVTLLAILNTKIQDQAQTIRDQQDRIYDLEGRTTDTRWLKEDLERAREESSNLRTQVYNLQAECQRLRLENPKVKEDLESYMTREGDTLIRQGSKIAAIKGVREITGWGLKESKDYVEARKVA